MALDQPMLYHRMIPHFRGGIRLAGGHQPVLHLLQVALHITRGRFAKLRVNRFLASGTTEAFRGTRDIRALSDINIEQVRPLTSLQAPIVQFSNQHKATTSFHIFHRTLGVLVKRERNRTDRHLILRRCSIRTQSRLAEMQTCQLVYLRQENYRFNSTRKSTRVKDRLLQGKELGAGPLGCRTHIPFTSRPLTATILI